MTTLFIGTINNLSTAVNVYFENVTTGNVLVLSGSSDGSGLVGVDVSDQQFADNQSYEIWVTLAVADMNARKDLVIGTETYDCLQATFLKVKDENGTIDAQTSFTITMA